MDTNKEPFTKANLEGQRDSKGRFLPGHAGNPNAKGRPHKEFSLTNLTREMIPQVCPYDPKGRTWGEYLVDRWLALATENPSYFKELMERLEGKVGQLEAPLVHVGRTVNIFVIDEETKNLIARVGDRTKELIPSENEQSLPLGKETDPDAALPLEERMKIIQARDEENREEVKHEKAL